MVRKQAEFFAGKRLFMFNMKLFFPEYLEKKLKADEYPFAQERRAGHSALQGYLEGKSLEFRLVILFSILDDREVRYLCLNEKPGNLLDETMSVLMMAEAQMKAADKGTKALLKLMREAWPEL